ncbi:uncharacterized protein ccdc14 isoform X2 [Archocentrus centrarchus]|uniref:uncharacterized protein ccdc14 isoform X2 n=1 Tax=Archocentrus centrarchus TaxID=63155 RepID=UPI0011E9E698|nr:coiled-coil domain-containing protein 14 isoform X2 [Archocentrus centrarchus]
MRGNAKREVVSSGRLTGAVRGRVAASRPGAASRPEPAYSLYSTDSEDQVTTLQKGLDRCAALLHGMLQADKAASPSLPRTVSSGAVRSRLSSSVGKKALKKLPPKAGGVAESLLSDLEQAVSTPQMNVGRSQCVSDPSALHSHNTQLHRHGRILNQQLKESEKAERHQKQEILSNSESKVLRLQEELTAAQHQLQELREDLSDLWDTLRDAQSQLREREAENALMKTDLEATKSRLLHSEQERSKLASLAEHRLKQMGHLNSLLQSRLSSDCLTAAESSVSDTDQQQHRLEPLAPPTDHIIQYLKSLGQSVHTEDVQYVAAEREGAPISHHDVKGQGSEEPAGPRVNRQKSNLEAQRPEEARRQHSQCDTESVWSDWSMKSRLTFDTRDEAAFRDGLAALDASIASLQKTIELDLKS